MSPSASPQLTYHSSTSAPPVCASASRKRHSPPSSVSNRPPYGTGSKDVRARTAPRASSSPSSHAIQTPSKTPYEGQLTRPSAIIASMRPRLARLALGFVLLTSAFAQNSSDNPGSSGTPPAANTPEPAAWQLILAGAGALAAARYYKNRRRS